MVSMTHVEPSPALDCHRPSVGQERSRDDVRGPKTVWRSPEEARRHGLSQDALAGATLEMFGNGFAQTDDVGERSKFRELGVAKIWRRVTLEPSQDSVRMNPRTDVGRSDGP